KRTRRSVRKQPTTARLHDVDADRPRLLARRSEVGYVDHPTRALQGEPEAISEADQERLAEQDRHAAEQRRTESLLASLDAVKRELRHYEAQARHCSRQIARLEHRLGRGIDA